MAVLNAAQRNSLPASDFARPDRSYPVPDRAHAANAKARATQAVKAGRMSESTKAHIDAKANAVLAHGRSKSHEAGMAHHPEGRRHAHGAE